MRLRTRIALFGAAVSAAAILGFSVLIYGLAAASIGGTQARDLARRADEAVAEWRGAPSPAGAGPLVLPVDLARSGDTFVEFLDLAGQPLVSTGQLAGSPPSIAPSVLQDANRQGSTVAITAGSVPLRVVVRVWRRSDGVPAGYVVAGQALRATASQLQGLHSFLVTSGILSFLGALAGNWWAAGRGLRPLREMAHAVEEIGQTRDLRRRLPVRLSRDDLGLLSGSFNRMLERVQEAHDRLSVALEAQRRFVADASHELRSPLTTIRSNASLLLRRPDVGIYDRQEALRDIASESERMSRLVQDLLTLARADAGQHLPRVPLDLCPLAAQVQRQAQAVYPDHHVELLAASAALVVGNADALTQLLWILLNNAAQHGGAAGTIQVQLVQTGRGVRLLVRDDGAGIPEADLPRIFERFYQADRARSGGGAGLGLAIAAWIVAEHGGSVAARNRSPSGAEFQIEFPPYLPLSSGSRLP